MRVIIKIPSGPLSGKQIELSPGQTVSVGRTRKADVVLNDDFLSGAHFALQCNAQGCRVRDLNSSNGTKLNGKLIIEAPLKSGDKLFAGHTDFEVRIEATKSRVTGKTSRQIRSGSISRSRISKSLPGGTSKKLSRSGASLSGTRKKKIQDTPAEPQPAPLVEKPLPPRLGGQPPAAAVSSAVSPAMLDSYYAATADGRLFQILSDQPQPLMALIDAVRDPKALELFRVRGAEFRSLYRKEQDQSTAPHLVRLPARSELLRQMIQNGWGHEWGVYLTCALPLQDLRDYFRKALMVTMPDGMELISRFYDPRFFRGFLKSCTAREAEAFFGPVTSYFMEDERPEILLEFTRSNTGAEKKGHLLSPLN